MQQFHTGKVMAVEKQSWVWGRLSGTKPIGKEQEEGGERLRCCRRPPLGLGQPGLSSPDVCGGEG